MDYPDEIEKQQKNKIANYFCKRLWNAPDSSIALEYLKERGLDDPKLIEKFKIGWCPQNQRSIQTLNLSFNGRVIFPIMDESGDVIALSGRLPRTAEKTEKKWLHESFSKEFCLYGLNVSVPNIIKKNYVVIVEGQADVLSCHRYGFDNTVGLMGTSFSKYAQYFLRSLTRNFILLLDSDESGVENAQKIEERLLTQNTLANISEGGGFHVVNINLSDFVKGKKCDPDNFLQVYKTKGINAIKKQIRKRSI